MNAVTIRDLRALDDCRAVVRIQEEVWGKDGEIVPASVLLVSAKSGGILLGAEVDGALVAFTWSMPGIRDGRLIHWSHMTGVLTPHRGRGVAMALKLAQRDRALAQGAEIIEWTFDPLQAVNAYFNLHVLGAVGVTYAENVYGNLQGPLHRGSPTDRLIVEWRLRAPHVVRRLEAHARGGNVRIARAAEVLDAPQLISTVDGRFVFAEKGPPDARRVQVAIPPRFLDLQAQAPEAALEWKLGIRGVMTSLFARGYVAVDFTSSESDGHGGYLFAKH